MDRGGPELTDGRTPPGRRQSPAPASRAGLNGVPPATPRRHRTGGGPHTMTAENTVKLSCRHLWKIYGPKPERSLDGLAASPTALAKRMREAGHIPAAVDVSFDVHVGETFVIMGLSGSGKSTVVRCLSRLTEPTRGEILLDGEDLLAKRPRDLIEIRRHKMGMVFQNFGLMPHLSVIENISFPLKLQGLPEREVRQRAARVIELVSLEGREDSYPAQLSGGQQQRVGIARSLAVEPDIWFLDEPFSALDPLIRRQMQDEFLALQRKLQKSIVFITHDFLEAIRVADRMMIMRDGRVIQMGTPLELIVNPVDEYVAEFASDVPLARVLRAGDVIEPSIVPTEDMPIVSAMASVQEILPSLAWSRRGIAVVHDNETLGVATPYSVIKSMARDGSRGVGDAADAAG